MRPSGIEWIGDIPDDWEICRLKRCLTIQNGLDYKSVRDDNGEFPVIGSGGQFDFASNYLYDGESVLFGRKGTVNKPLYVNGKFWTVDTMFYSMIKPNACGKFIFYAATIIPFDFYSTATAVPSMTQRDLINHYVVLPPLSKQRIIADYLDEKCGEIDATIAKQKESIEKLKAYKQSLISETVTKGLDKSAPLKPSGIEWIGDIPDDWEVTKISRLYSIQLGKMLQPEKKSSGDTYEPYICAANLSSGTFRLDEMKYMWISEPEKDIYRLKRDDLLVTEGGDVGISSIWKDDISPCYFQNALHRVVPKKGNSNRFLHYWLIVLKSVGYIDLICNKSTIAHFTKEKFAQSLILSIPLQTQEKIADYLDSKCSQIDKYITEKQNIIQKLDAYKKSLIFEYVTGKQKM